MLVSLTHICKGVCFTGQYMTIPYSSISAILSLSGSDASLAHHCAPGSAPRIGVSDYSTRALALLLKLNCHDSQAWVLDTFHTSIHINCHCSSKHKSSYLQVFSSTVIPTININHKHILPFQCFDETLCCECNSVNTYTQRD